ncbi:unnamed protein product (plasmid) [Mycetohabitans rhizoxinica HKI 454]|uniref:Uncharacterized protein n=1 Tax=Mycetohabitans rhizoxinica (strain DSM 19002 / CIP 109453 / HKI 454) TaxID=882378 RepID=E5ATN7_MYCRK|nr:unnamed protein product [Mycetohabitans rhizoxinica HKI 454]
MRLRANWHYNRSSKTVKKNRASQYVAQARRHWVQY